MYPTVAPSKIGGINAHTIGWFLMIVGIVDGTISMIFWQSWAGPGYLTRRRTASDEAAIASLTTRPYKRVPVSVPQEPQKPAHRVRTLGRETEGRVLPGRSEGEVPGAEPNRRRHVFARDLVPAHVEVVGDVGDGRPFDPRADVVPTDRGARRMVVGVEAVAGFRGQVDAADNAFKIHFGDRLPE
jgi:hypothetical protein